MIHREEFEAFVTSGTGHSREAELDDRKQFLVGFQNPLIEPPTKIHEDF